MPSLSKSVPKLRKKTVSGHAYAIVTLDGKDVYIGPHGAKSNQAEYDRLISEWLTNGRRATVSSERTITVVELCLRYWEFAKTFYVKNDKPTDELASIKMAIRHTRKLYGKSPVSEFGPLALEVIREAMIARGNSRSYINKNVSRIRRIFQWGVAKQIVPVEIHQAG